MSMVLRGACVLGLVLGLVACGGDDAVTPPTACVAGVARACTCASGTAGVETCAADGSGFGACGACAARTLAFLEARQYPVGSASPHSVVAVDLDGDAWPEARDRHVRRRRRGRAGGRAAQLHAAERTASPRQYRRTAPGLRVAVADAELAATAIGYGVANA